MKRVYWRPQKISKMALLLIGLLAVGGTLAIEAFPTKEPASERETKLVAAQLAERGMLNICAERRLRGHQFDKRFDPAQSGMIGAVMTPVTSLPAHLDAKQTSVNPNFAAAVVEMLTGANVSKGDVVAIGYTGSFPAFNTCVCTALEAIGAEPIVIHSAASSQFGANAPDMMWLDMESVLYEQGVISFRSTAATLGGFGDRARGMSDDAQALIAASLDRNEVPPIKVESLRQSIARRMQLYDKQAAGRPIKAYVNVGGGAASIHGAEGRSTFSAGLNTELPGDAGEVDCVAYRFAKEGIPVIHVGNAITLAKRYDFAVAPQSMPEVGTGAVFSTTQPSRLLAATLLIALLVVIRIYVWTDLWTRWKSQLLAFISPPPRNEKGLRLVSSQRAELMV
ncbi:MAG: poly-gamma-glutamate system protein [Aeoliella sp.]